MRMHTPIGYALQLNIGVHDRNYGSFVQGFSFRSINIVRKFPNYSKHRGKGGMAARLFAPTDREA